MSKREALAALSPYVPGTTIEEIKRKLGLEQIIKLASNENPLGSSPKALAAMRHLDKLHLYLDDAYPELREMLAAPEGLHFENVILGHGSNELVNIVAQAVIEPGDDVVMAVPTFSLYALAAACQGGNVVEVPLLDGVHDLDAMLAAITPRTSLLFICDPNNPTGTALDPNVLERFLKRVPESVCVVVDRAYQEYMDPRPPPIERPNTLVLRTMSKIYGLASLRFGYGFADRELIAWLNRIRLPFNVSRPAALGARGALDDAEFVATSIASNQAGKQQLMPALQALGLPVYATQANFYAVGVPVSATRAYEEFLQRGIIVRSGDALHMPHYLRITIGTHEQNIAVLSAFEALLPQWRA
ncbi:MAG: histidinol-phosphate transaminase [Vulcanimicrobiaceae bacterium]